MGMSEVKVYIMREPMLDPKLESPWALLFKEKTCGGCLPIYIPSNQAEFIQKLLLEDETIPLESVLDDLSLPAEQISKGTMESIIIEQTESNRFQARLMLIPDDKTDEIIQVELPVGRAVALSFITQVPIYIDETLLIHIGDSQG